MRSVASYVDAGFPCVYVRTTEFERAFKSVLYELQSAGLNDLSVYVWKCTTGLYPHTEGPVTQLAGDFMEALAFVDGEAGEKPLPDCLYVFFNIREFIKSPGAQQKFRDVAYSIRTVGSYIVVLGADIELPQELEDLVTVIDFELPTKDQIRAIFGRLVQRMGVDADPEQLEQAAINATGLTAFRAESAIALSIVEKKQIDLDMIREEKRQVLKKSGALEFLKAEANMDELGGFDNLKEHVKVKGRYFKDPEKAREYGILSPPKGILLVGLAGTGKTLSARCIAGAMGLDLYKLDLSSVFKSLVGGSESAIRQALKVAETVAPAVILMDEFEKMVSGVQSSGRSDSGTTSRVVGTLLSWMQDSKAPLYKVATCNSIRDLDGALFRRGRWDGMFSVDLPTPKERKDIFAIHLRKRRRDPKAFDLDVLSHHSQGFVGAEIESAVEESLYKAFHEDREVTTEDIVSVCKAIIPISVTDKEQMTTFRAWVKNRATPVSSAACVESTPESGGDRRIRNSGSTDDVNTFIRGVKIDN